MHRGWVSITGAQIQSREGPAQLRPESRRCLVLPTLCSASPAKPPCPFLSHPPGHCPWGFKAIRRAAATAKHAAARVSEVVTQTWRGRLHRVCLGVSKTQGWMRCFSSLHPYPGATNAHAPRHVPPGVCSSACKAVVAAGATARRCCRSARTRSAVCVSAGLQGLGAQALASVGLLPLPDVAAVPGQEQLGLPSTAGGIRRHWHGGRPTRCHGHGSSWVFHSRVFLTAVAGASTR